MSRSHEDAVPVNAHPSWRDGEEEAGEREEREDTESSARDVLEDQESGPPATPTVSRWRRIAARTLGSWKSVWSRVTEWVRGPQPPRIHSLSPPLFRRVQHAPIRLLDRYAPRPSHRLGLLLLLYAAWILCFALVVWRNNGGGGHDTLSCYSSFWWGSDNGCGLDGNSCRPFDNQSFAFRCPADCSEAQIYEPYTVGDFQIVYQNLVVGGPSIPSNATSSLADGLDTFNSAVYRGDSFICPAAIHAGYISDHAGGCAVLSLIGPQSSYESTRHNGILSVAFPSYFPQSIAFLADSVTACQDLRWYALAVSAVATALLSLFTTSPPVFFWSTFVALFFTIAIATDPPSSSDFADLFSLTLGSFLPAAFCAAVIYHFTVHRTLSGLTAQFDKTVLWLGAAWIAALNNYTFDRMPLQRLTPHDIHAQPGALAVLICVIVALVLVTIGQVWAIRIEGRLPRYLALYAMLVATLCFLLALPGLHLRLHHYIVALLLLPGTALQTRPSLLYQGLLFGLFVNGIARWGFASVVETPTELFRGGPQGTLIPPVRALSSPDAANASTNISFDLGPLPVYDRNSDLVFDGFSALVNDVERWRGYVDGDDSAQAGVQIDGNWTWTWTRCGGASTCPGAEDVDVNVDAPQEFFRFAYMSGSDAGDFSQAGVWKGDGVWIPGED